MVFQNYINMMRDAPDAKKPFEGVNILDALSASGLRTIRFLKELSGVKKLYTNDISISAINTIKENLKLNEIPDDRVHLTQEDGNSLMFRAGIQARDYNSTRADPGALPKFDIIDLDPYGSAVPFLDSSLQAIRSDGIENTELR
jgi:tRNA (guanine26-N2/guanine27-N2)-dimethyltransferase